MQYPSLAQLAKMSSEVRRQRLRGIDQVSREKLVLQTVQLLNDICANVEVEAK